MRKVIWIYLRCLLVITGIVFTAGCGTVMTPAITPTVFVTPSATFTPAPLYIHYTPPKGSEVHLEFDYPGYWYFSEGNYPYTEGYSIFLSDPLILTLPTRDPKISNDIPSNHGQIYVWIEPLEAGQRLSNIVDVYRSGVQESLHYIVLIRDYPTRIDKQDAYVFEIFNDTPEMYTTTMFERIIFFIIEDKVYSLDFVVSMDERGGEFEKGYEYFLNSLMIIP